MPYHHSFTAVICKTCKADDVLYQCLNLQCQTEQVPRTVKHGRAGSETNTQTPDLCILANLTLEKGRNLTNGV